MRRASALVRAIKLQRSNKILTTVTSFGSPHHSVFTCQRRRFHPALSQRQQQQVFADARYTRYLDLNSVVPDYIKAQEYFKKWDYRMVVAHLEPMVDFLFSDHESSVTAPCTRAQFQASVSRMLCISYFKLEEYDKCVQCCDRLIQEEANFKKLNMLDELFNALNSAMIQKGKVLSEREDYVKAARYFNFIMESRIIKRLNNSKSKSPEFIAESMALCQEIYIADGRNRLSQGECQHALDIFENALAWNEEDAQTHTLIGITKLLLGRESEGYEDIARGLSLNDGNPYVLCDTWVGEAVYLMEVKKDLERAYQLSQQALDLLPDYFDALGIRLLIFFRQGNYEMVAKEGKRISDKNPSKFADIFPTFCDAMIRLHRYQEAIELADRLTESFPTIHKWMSHMIRVAIDCAQGKSREVLNYIDKINNAEFHEKIEYLALECYLKLEEYDKLNDFVTRYRANYSKLDPRDQVVVLLVEWIVDLRTKGISNTQTPHPIPNEIQEILEQGPQPNVVTLLLGEGLYSSGHYDKALELATTQEMDTGIHLKLWAHELAARVHKSSGNLEMAQSHWKQVLAISPQYNVLYLK